MATVNRKEAAAQASVKYIGAPEFKRIESTALEYAVNTPSDVIKSGGQFYLLEQGVGSCPVQQQVPGRLLISARGDLSDSSRIAKTQHDSMCT